MAKQDYVPSKETLLRIFRATESREARAALPGTLLMLADQTHENQADMDHFCAQLKADYSGLPGSKFALTQFDPDPPLAPGKPLPDFNAPRLDSGELDTAAYRGHYLLLDFWSTWCQPRVEALPAHEIDELGARDSSRRLPVDHRARAEKTTIVTIYFRQPISMLRETPSGTLRRTIL
jgi:hypothetical protein